MRARLGWRALAALVGWLIAVPAVAAIAARSGRSADDTGAVGGFACPAGTTLGRVLAFPIVPGAETPAAFGTSDELLDWIIKHQMPPSASDRNRWTFLPAADVSTAVDGTAIERGVFRFTSVSGDVMAEIDAAGNRYGWWRTEVRGCW